MWTELEAKYSWYPQSKFLPSNLSVSLEMVMAVQKSEAAPSSYIQLKTMISLKGIPAPIAMDQHSSQNSAPTLFLSQLGARTCSLSATLNATVYFCTLVLRQEMKEAMLSFLARASSVYLQLLGRSRLIVKNYAETRRGRRQRQRRR